MQTPIQNKDQWSATATSYKEGALEVNLSNAPKEKLFEKMNLAFPFSTATSILDVGSGPGVTIGKIIETYSSQLGADVRLIASDFSAGMISQIQEIRKQKAQEQQNGSSLWNRLEAKVLDAQILEGIEDSSISHITGTMVYNLVANPHQALEAAHRVLLPGGIIGMTLGAGAEWMDIMALAAREIRGPSAPAFKFPPAYSTIPGLTTEFSTIGFTPEFFETVETFMDVTDTSPLIDIFIRGKNPGAMFFVGDYSEEELNDFVQEVQRVVVERHPETPRKLRGEMIVVVGRKL